MQPLPAQDLRRNLGTWAVPPALAPAVGRALLDALPPERFDPTFLGQRLETTYFDSAAFDLRRARRSKDRYLTLRVRCYRAPGAAEVYALSAKTEARKFRREIAAGDAEAILDGDYPGWPADLLPADLQARLLALVGDAPLAPVVTVCCRRYAAEDDVSRLTLDLGVCTDTGLRLPHGVLEFKTATGDAPPPSGLAALRLRPVKLSKFLWATGGGR
jgi:hypothetical protein